MSRATLGRRTTGPSPTPQLTMAWQSASLLLGYPDEELLGHLDLVAAGVAASCPSRWAGRCGPASSRLREAPLTELEEDYVDTFDNRRRHNLFLTYFAHGDTRKRGMALLRFKQTYLASGFELTDTELPDHLCVVLEYAATVDREAGRAADPRPPGRARAAAALARRGRLALGRRGRGGDAPPCRRCRATSARRCAELAAAGPPEEEVGLTPYATPAFDPGPALPDGPTPLPMPSFPGAR